MATDQEITEQIVALLDEIEADIHWSPLIRAKVARARDLVRKLSPQKPDGA